MERRSWCGLAALCIVVGCGKGATEPAESPDSVAVIDPEPASPTPTPEPEEIATEAEEEAAPEPQPAAPNVEFPENASVDQAIEAVPAGTERVNLDPDELARPLQEPDLYEQCKVGAQHFKLRVAVWNGRAVGVDVDTRNAKLAECIKEQVRKVEWRDKVPSLNTIEYGL